MVFAARMGVGKCVSGDTEIPSPITGIYRDIRSVVRDRGDVYTRGSYGVYSGVSPSGHWNTGRKKCLKITTRSGLSIETTPEHPYSVVGGWMAASELCVGDCIETVKFMPEPFEANDSVPSDHVLLLAALLTEDGSIIDPFSFSNVDPDILGIVTRAVRNLSSEDVRVFLSRWGVSFDGSVGEVIPDQVFSLSNRLLAKFIGMFWSCIGRIDGSDGISIVSCSSRIVQQIKRLLLRFGITGMVRHSLIDGEGGKTSDSWEFLIHPSCIGLFKEHIPIFGIKKQISLSLRDSVDSNVDSVPLTPWLRASLRSIIRDGVDEGIEIDEVGRLVGWTLSFSVNDLFRHRTIGKRLLSAFGDVYDQCDFVESLCRPYWDEIADIVDVGERDVFDLSVDNTHCFVANDIVAHNTFALLMMARQAWMDGHTVLFVGTEMSRLKLAIRFYAIHLGLPYKELRAGMLGEFREDELFKGVQSVLNSEGLYVVGDDFDASIVEIEAAVEEVNPGILFVDGLYLVKNEGKDRHSRVSNNADDLKRLARRKDIPVITSTQFNRDVKQNSKSAVDAGNVGITDVIGWNCLCPESLVVSGDGLVRLSDLDGEVELWDGNGMSNCFVVDVGEKDVWEVVLETGLRLRCSGDHRVFVPDGLSYRDVPVEDLTCDDAIPVLFKTDFGCDSIGHFEFQDSGSKFLFPELWTDDLAAFLGYCIGYAWLSGDNTWQIPVSYNDVDLVGKLNGMVSRSFFGYECTTLDAASVKLLGLNSVEIIGFMRWLGIDRVWGSGTRGIPYRIWTAPRGIRMAFLQGLFEADGFVSGLGNVCLDTVSGRLSQDVLKLLLSVGIHASVRTVSINQARDDEYKIWIPLGDSVVFMKEIGFLSDRKNAMAVERCFGSTRERGRIPVNLSYVRRVGPTGEKVMMKDVVGTDRGIFVADFMPVHNSDVMFGQYQTDDMSEDNIMGFRPIKIREGKGHDFFVRWDFGSMTFEEMDGPDADDFKDNDYDKIPGAVAADHWGNGDDDGGMLF